MTRIKVVPVIPKRGAIPDKETVRLSIEDALDNIADEGLALFKATTATWKHQVKFKINRTKDGRTITTSDKIYGKMDLGTKRHIIRARRAPMLVFRAGGFKAKTKVRVLSSFRGSPGQNWVSKKQVKHPGTKARQFSAIIGERMGKRIAQEMAARFKALAKQ